MYLPEPEVKQRSRLVTWTLRLVLIFICLAGFFFLSLSLLAGTTDSHKRGLEAALSELVKAPVNIGVLRELNIIPQFRFDIENVTSQKASIERLKMAYGFWDLFLGRPYIEDINFENLRIPAGIVGPFSVVIDKGSISQDAQFIFSGTIQKNKLHGEIVLDKLPQRFRPSYQILTPDVRIDLGDINARYTIKTGEKVLVILANGATSEFIFEDSQFVTNSEGLWLVLKDKEEACTILELREQPESRLQFKVYALDRPPISFDPQIIKLGCAKGSTE